MGDYGFEGAGDFAGSDYEPCSVCDGKGTVGYKDVTCGRCDGKKVVKKNIISEYKTSFTVFPQHCNYNDPPSIFGGKMLAEMDNAAAMCVRRVLYGTECTDAVTVGVNNVGFHRPAYIGEIVHITAKLHAMGDRSITIMVECERESKRGDIKAMAKGVFTFVSRIKGMPSKHGLTMP
jgi:acyl-CoA hydrolase